MTHYDENFMSMAHSSMNVMDENMDGISTIAAFVTAKAKAKELIKNILAEEGKIKNATTGISLDKQTLKLETAELAYMIVSATQAYAHSTHNMELLKSIDFTTDQLMRLRTEQFGPVLANILSIATELKLALKEHGLDQEDLDDLTDLIAVWDGKKQSTRKAILNRKTSNQKQDELMEELNHVYNYTCDNYVNKLKRKFPDFYSKYYNARKVTSLGVKHESVIPNTNPV